jgi:hypothetical protein
MLLPPTDNQDFKENLQKLQLNKIRVIPAYRQAGVIQTRSEAPD